MSLKRSNRLPIVVASLAIAVLAWLAFTLGRGGAGPEASVPDDRAAASAKAPLESPPVLSPRLDAEPSIEREEVEAEPSEKAAGVSSAETGVWELRGRVVDPTGGGVARALVGLLQLEGERPGHRGQRAVVEADALGHFVVAVPGWARESRVLLMARSSGWQPYSQRVELTAADLLQPRQLDLRVGHELSGRVIRSGMPVPSARVSVDAAYGTGGVFGAGSEAWWGNDRLQEKHGQTQTDENGLFTLSGFGAYPHRLQIDPPERAVRSAVDHLYSAPVPGHRVYDLSTARLGISVTGPRGLVSGASVHVMNNGRGHEVHTAAEPVLVDVPPMEMISLVVRHPTSREVTLEIETPGAGQQRDVTVPLEIVERPSMTVLIPGATAAGITMVGLRLQTNYGFTDEELQVVRGASPDTFDVPLIAMEPGEYNLALEPSSHGGAGTYIEPQVERIQLPRIGRVYAEFKLGLFGRCTVSVGSAHTGDWRSTYRFKNAQGEQVLERSIHHSGASMGFDSDGTEFVLDGNSTMDVQIDISTIFHGKRWATEDPGRIAKRCGVLPAGSYSVEVESEGHQKWRGSVQIVAGKTTSLEVVLVPNGA